MHYDILQEIGCEYDEKKHWIYVKNIEQLFIECGVDTLFSQKNVMEWLQCSKAKVIKVMKMMKDVKIIEKVSGFGAGKYKFINL